MEKESLYVQIKAFFARIFDVRQEKKTNKKPLIRSRKAWSLKERTFGY